ncbi:MAG: nucleoside-triphosphatase [Candidatus Bipolaricaulota bacterium]|nr:nucleoside-triphosphatase [Candidatus Bipolaricaulota bacterium]
MDILNERLTQVIAEITEQITQHKHRCIVIHGQIGAGKTRLAQRLAAALEKHKIRVGGIISPRIVDGVETIGYRVRDLDTGEEQSLAALNPPGIPIGKFYLSEDALLFARTAIEHAAATAQVVFLDEVGRLELTGQGHAPALRALLRSEAIHVLFVRTTFVEHIIEKFGIGDHASFSVEPGLPDCSLEEGRP